MEVRLDAKGFDALEKALKRHPQELKKATVAAVNRTAAKVKNTLVREMKKTYDLKTLDLKQVSQEGKATGSFINLHKASFSRPESYIAVRGRPYNLYRFIQSPKLPVSHLGKSIEEIKKIRLPRVRVMKASAKTAGSHTFVALGKQGESGRFLGVFQRRGKKADMLHTLSLAQMASNERVKKSTLNQSGQILEKTVRQEIDYRLQKLAGGVT